MSLNNKKSRNVRDAPAYPLSEAARYLRLPVATLRSWVIGREYPTAQGAKDFSPLLKPASAKPVMLSFSNLIEAHVVKSLRTDHGVSVKALRAALRYAQKELSIDRLLLSSELCTSAGNVFLERYGQLVDLSASGQLAMRKVLEIYLSRLERDESKFPIRLYPFVSESDGGGERRIVIDPSISFGRPVLVRKGVSTAVIAERIDAGESVEDIAADYDLEPGEIEHAALYERAA